MPNKVVLSIKTQSQTFKCILAFISRCCIDNEITLKRVKYRLPQLPDEMIDTFLLYNCILIFQHYTIIVQHYILLHVMFYYTFLYMLKLSILC